ncbi:sodium:solute symporter, partial [bacterium]|nr:sodium:solute symporter [bacterium]
KTRNAVYVTFMGIVLIVMVGIYSLEADSIISGLFTAAGYTYGPLLGLFAMALMTNRRLQGWWVLLVCIAAPIITYQLSLWAPSVGYAIGFELLLYNGLFTFLGLLAISKPSRLN